MQKPRWLFALIVVTLCCTTSGCVTFGLSAGGGVRTRGQGGRGAYAINFHGGFCNPVDKRLRYGVEGMLMGVGANPYGALGGAVSLWTDYGIPRYRINQDTAASWGPITRLTVGWVKVDKGEVKFAPTQHALDLFVGVYSDGTNRTREAGVGRFAAGLALTRLDLPPGEQAPIWTIGLRLEASFVMNIGRWVDYDDSKY
jgi:hypothetical protein